MFFWSILSWGACQKKCSFFKRGRGREGERVSIKVCKGVYFEKKSKTCAFLVNNELGNATKKNAHFLHFFLKEKGGKRRKRGGKQKTCIFLVNIELRSALKKFSFFFKGEREWERVVYKIV